jgi:hypothetical protein
MSQGVCRLSKNLRRHKKGATPGVKRWNLPKRRNMEFSLDKIIRLSLSLQELKTRRDKRNREMKRNENF